ncbi:MAG: hypothetical protein JWM21_5019 [Acidobacteria bacterium]|nr:hypothetical protein [Acidobacteriota bacterium]
MGSLSGSDFRKKWRCPSSEDLVAYPQRKLANLQASHINAHLAICDFCAAELQLLSKFPSAEHCTETPAMPVQLRVLAEALLTRGSFRQQSGMRVDKGDGHG